MGRQVVIVRVQVSLKLFRLEMFQVQEFPLQVSEVMDEIHTDQSQFPCYVVALNEGVHYLEQGIKLEHDIWVERCRFTYLLDVVLLHILIGSAVLILEFYNNRD